MKYLKRLTNNEEYTAFKNSEEYVEPHVATIADEIIIYKPLIVLPSFFIGDTQYYFEEGMTWCEWLGSEYNVDSYRFEHGEIGQILIFNKALTLYVVGVEMPNPYGEDVPCADFPVIIEDGVYSLTAPNWPM